MNPEPSHSQPEIPSLVRRWAPAVAWMGVILYFSSRPRPLGPVGDTAYGGLIGRLAHVAEYAVLAALLHRALGGALDKWRRTAVAFLAAVTFACIDEAFQGLIPGRQSSLLDVAYDAFGAATALLTLRLLAHLRRGPASRCWRSARKSSPATNGKIGH